MSEDDRFLTEINQHLDEGIAAYRNDRAGHGHLTDAEFVHMFGNTLVDSVSPNPKEALFTLAVALHRLASMPLGSGAYPPKRLFVAEGHTDKCSIGTDLPGTLSMTCTCGGLWRAHAAENGEPS